MDVAAIGAAAAPVVQEEVACRVLQVDGDALAYSCAGNDDTAPGQAFRNVLSRISAAKRRCGATSVEVLCTLRTSHKGHRYAVARVKPYQGQRKSGRRPKNYEYLRDILERGGDRHEQWGRIKLYDHAEADDGFGVGHDPANVVIHTEDKDMQMKSGWHLSWDLEHLIYVEPGTWELVHHGKTFGRKWFWLQMLHGDGADNIPGLPTYVNANGKDALCGPVTAAKLLADCANEAEARAVVFGLYKGTYGDGWQTQVLEQAVLLWMRTSPRSPWNDVLLPGNPLSFGSPGPDYAWTTALVEIERRVGG
jgi:hypothetical protein